MPELTCRVCGRALFPEPLLVYPNQPKAAQHLPTAQDLATEHGIDLEVCQCSACGLVQLSNEPVDYWREVIRASAGSPEMMAFRREQFGEFVQRFDLTGKRVFEPGCGRGEYLAIMADAGADARGLEFGESAVVDARAAGLFVDRGFITAASAPQGAPFSAFFTLNYLEHVPDPLDFLTGIHANLEDGGVGLVEVPNFDMIIAEGLFAEFITDHLCYFTRDTLATTLALGGFEVLACEVVWHDYIVSATVRKAAAPAPALGRPVPAFVPLDVARFRESYDRIHASVRGFLRTAAADGRRIAIWGAGHQALTMISMFGLAEFAAYVVDSAPFKQGRFTPATHLPIDSPDALADSPVDTLIIMAASYSDEIVRLVRERFGDSMRIGVLTAEGIEDRTCG